MPAHDRYTGSLAFGVRLRGDPGSLTSSREQTHLGRSRANRATRLGGTLRAEGTACPRKLQMITEGRCRVTNRESVYCSSGTGRPHQHTEQTVGKTTRAGGTMNRPPTRTFPPRRPCLQGSHDPTSDPNVPPTSAVPSGITRPDLRPAPQVRYWVFPAATPETQPLNLRILLFKIEFLITTIHTSSFDTGFSVCGWVRIRVSGVPEVKLRCPRVSPGV
jgi:hypothetical protein